jgi:hypothetical protein
MSDVEHFALIVPITAVAVVAAVLCNRISERIRVPAPAIFLVAAAVAFDVIPAFGPAVGHHRSAGGDGGSCGHLVRRRDADLGTAVPAAD